MKRQIFFTQIGGFDTHSAEIGGQGSLLTQVSQAINAFFAATVELGVQDKVTTFTMSDFGRTLQPAGTGVNAVGTDHAWGNHQLIAGGSVLGHTFYGTYPTLRSVDQMTLMADQIRAVVGYRRLRLNNTPRRSRPGTVVDRGSAGGVSFDRSLRDFESRLSGLMLSRRKGAKTQQISCLETRQRFAPLRLCAMNHSNPLHRTAVSARGDCRLPLIAQHGHASGSRFLGWSTCGLHRRAAGRTRGVR